MTCVCVYDTCVSMQGMSRLMHSIYEGVETSIKQPTNGSTALRVKLVLTPVSQSDRLSQSGDSERSIY